MSFSASCICLTFPWLEERLLRLIEEDPVAPFVEEEPIELELPEPALDDPLGWLWSDELPDRVWDQAGATPIHVPASTTTDNDNVFPFIFTPFHPNLLR